MWNYLKNNEDKGDTNVIMVSKKPGFIYVVQEVAKKSFPTRILEKKNTRSHRF